MKTYSWLIKQILLVTVTWVEEVSEKLGGTLLQYLVAYIGKYII